MNNKVTRPELNRLAKANGNKYYLKYNRFELAEKLCIELPKPKPKPKITRVRARPLRVINSDGIITTYPSMTQMAKFLSKFPMQIYAMVAKGEAEFL